MSEQKKTEPIVMSGFNAGIHYDLSRPFPSGYAQTIVMQPLRDDVALYFFETTMPLFSNDETVRAKQIEELQQTGVPSRCIAKISVPLRVFLETADLMKNLAEQLKASMTVELEKPE